MIGAIFMKFGRAPATIVILIEVYTELKSFHQKKGGRRLAEEISASSFDTVE